MISKNNARLIRSLALKKNRIKQNLFVVEGDKNVKEVLSSTYHTRMVIATDEFISIHEGLLKKVSQVVQASREEIKTASLLQNPQSAIAVCHLPSATELPRSIHDFSLYLDGIQDPGNLGTIIRTCDWFGIKTLFCSKDTADVYNPKVIQATMGSFSRVNLIYTDMDELAQLAIRSGVEIYGTFMDGNSIYTEKTSGRALLVLGNEGNGIRSQVERYINKRISIPPGPAGTGAESLNVAVAAGIVCAEFIRQNYITRNETKG